MIQPVNTDSAKGSFAGVCRYCKKKAGHKCKNCLDSTAKQVGSGTGSKKKCRSCKKSGHTDADCWKRHPAKVPQWFKDMAKKGKTARNSVEVVLHHIRKCS